MIIAYYIKEKNIFKNVINLNKRNKNKIKVD
jgi:hypothetical protein